MTNSLISDRISNMAESETLVMAQKSRELQEKGIDVISLSLGEPDFNTPDFVKDAAKEAIDNNFTTYMPVPGYLDLREAICLKLKRDNGLDYAPNQIVVSTGAKHSIANICLSLLNKGDEVLLPVPYWVSYREIVRMAEAIPVEIPSTIETNFKITTEQIRKHITPKTKLIIFSTPCNPSGSVYSKKELKSIADLISEYPNILVLSDEIYEHINFVGKHESLAQFSNIKDQTITVNGVSKAFAMTGWRIGYLAAPKWIADACVKMQGQFTSGACGIAQKAAKAALLSEPSATDYMCKAFHKRRDLVLELLNEISGVKTNIPEGAFYVFPDISYYFGKTDGEKTIANATDLSMYLLLKGHVAVVSGEAFGSPECIRISYATSEDRLREAIDRLKKSLEKLK